MDLSELKGIINLMQKSDLSELEIELQDLKLRLARPGVAQPLLEQVTKPQVTVQTSASPKSVIKHLHLLLRSWE